MRRIIKSLESNFKRTSRARVSSADHIQDFGRREIFRKVACGVAIPAALFLTEATAESSSQNISEPDSFRAMPFKHGLITRDFGDPWIELMRLLHEAAEVEHSLMIQYLYAAFSIKKDYQKIIGYGAPGSNDLLGVAIQEMQHLGKVNQLLVALGAAPTLIREDFPYEPEIYPFVFNLEPLSHGSLAKYVWTESPPGATDFRRAENDEDRKFCQNIELALGNNPRPNYIGNLYDSIIYVMKELDALKDLNIPDLRPWISEIHDIKTQGEVDHFRFFKSLFTGNHAGFGGVSDVWSRPASDPRYPANQLLLNPTAYQGHDRQIQDPQACSLAWLGNLHYWIILNLLSEGYSHGSSEHIALARAHMMGPFLALAGKLSVAGAGMPFDPLGIGYSPGLTRQANTRILSHLLNETDKLEKLLNTVLPADYPENFCQMTLTAIKRLEPKINAAHAPILPWDDGLA